MSSCPNCQQTIDILDQHKGALFNCPHCRAVFFVDWDGNPEGVAAHEAEPASPAPDESFAAEEPSPFSMPIATEPPFPENPVAMPAAPEPGFEMASGPPQDNFHTFENAADELAEVVEFGNQDLSVGPLTYTVYIQGLELADTFEKLREALTDSRFGWDAEDLMAQVQSGRLELKGINPTKASILINRIKYLPIELSWKQEVFGGTT